MRETLMGLLTMVLATCVWPSAWASDWLPDGTFQGTSTGGDRIELVAEPSDDLLEITLTINGKPIERSFRPDPDGQGYSGVTSGMFSMFGDDDPAQPLEGDPLFWARSEDAAFIFYNLVIKPTGHFLLERVDLEPGDAGIEISIEIWQHNKASYALSASLTGED